jgi:site-specific DNA recombinase
MIRFAFHGRVSTQDQQDPELSKGWQPARSRALIEPWGDVIVRQFFDVDKSPSVAWQRRPGAAALPAPEWAVSSMRWSSASRTASSTSTSTG